MSTSPPTSDTTLRSTRWRAPAARAVSSAAAIGVLTLVARSISAGREVVVARLFGVSAEVDAYLLASALPWLVASVIAGSFAAAFVPAYVRHTSSDGIRAGQLLFIDAMRSTMRWVVIGTAVTIATSALLLHFDAVAAPEDRLAVRLLAVMVFGLVPAVLAGGGAALLNANERFMAAAAAPALSAAIAITVLLAANGRWGITALAWGNVLGFTAEAAFLLSLARRRGLISLWARGAPNVPSSGIGRGMVLVALASVLATASPVVDQFMAATLGEGRVATLGYANRIVSVVLVVIATGVGTVLLPRFSSAAVESEGGQLRTVFRRSARMAFAVACAVAVALIGLADPLVRTLLQGGELTRGDADMIVEVLRLYALQVPFYVFGVIGARLLNALGRNSWLVVMGLANLVVNVGLNLLLMSRYGVRGIAMGTSAVYALSSCVMVFVTRAALRRSDGRLAGAKT